jgi:hypothetical protein
MNQEPQGEAAHRSPRGSTGGLRTQVAARSASVLDSGRGLLAPLSASVVAGIVVALLLHGHGSDFRHVAGLFIALGAVVLALDSNRWLLGLGALISAWFVAFLTIKYVPQLINPGPPVSVAVGQAAFDGTPYRGSQLGAVVSVGVFVLIALTSVALPAVARWRSGSREKVARPSVSPSPRTARPNRNGPLVVLIGVAVLAATIVPDLRAYLKLEHAPVAYGPSFGWDVANGVAWHQFVQLGLVPMKDFFYPYGFQWLYELRSFGPVFAWLTQVAILAVAAWSAWRLSGGRTARVLACLLAVVLIGLAGSEAWRYLPAFLVGTTYAALGPLAHKRLQPEHLIFGASCLVALLTGFEVLGIGLAGAVMVLAGEAVAGRVRGRPQRLVFAAIADVAPVAVAVIVVLVTWLAMGAAGGYLRFIGDISAVSSSSALDQIAHGPQGFIKLAPDTLTLFSALPAMLAAIGFVWARAERGLAKPGVAALLLSASGVTLVLLLKQFVRPVGDELLIAPLVALAWAAILTWRADSLIRAAASGAALVALYLPLHDVQGYSLVDYLHTAVDSPVHAVHSISVAFDRGARTRAYQAQFNGSRFLGWPDVNIATDYLIATGQSTVPPFAVVGDSQLLYVLLRQRPPYQVELYDAAPIAEQKVMLDRLRRESPPYVIWRKDEAIDYLPYYVRDPLVFRWMVDNYVPVHTTAAADILRRRSPTEPLAGTFWRTELSGTEDLGFIPSYSTAAGAATCPSGPGCVPYAFVRGRPTRGDMGLGLVVSGNGVRYGVTLRTRAGVDTYPIRLDRLWFWPLVGSAATVRSLTPGFTATTGGLRSGDNLY